MKQGFGFYVDTHAHLDLIEDKQPADVVREADGENVKIIITVGISVESSHKAVQISSQFENVFASVGIHVHDASAVFSKDFQEVVGLAKSDRVVALGETGLDYYRNYSEPGDQKQLFMWHIESANKLYLPLIIHCRNSDNDMIEMLYENRVKNGVMHCFSGGESLLKACLDLGLYISFAGNITYKNAGDLRTIAKKVPVERLLVETDSPYLSPQENRGKTNYPKFVPQVASMLARIKNLSPKYLMEATTRNAIDLFGLEC
ncbi:MAG: TatD family hydrolase [Actinobacteria bacterium]|nr:TatD family hydrolase [Actinomycetota bacterium]